MLQLLLSSGDLINNDVMNIDAQTSFWSLFSVLLGVQVYPELKYYSNAMFFSD